MVTDAKREQNRLYHEAHKDAIRKRKSVWYQQNKERLRVRGRTYYYQTGGRYSKGQRVRDKYNLTVQEYDNLIESRRGICDICGGKMHGLGTYKPCLDHDHNTGKIRGVLCRNCNLLLGYAGDSVTRLDAAISYLKKNS